MASRVPEKNTEDDLEKELVCNKDLEAHIAKRLLNIFNTIC